jgi:hypothetical protein
MAVRTLFYEDVGGRIYAASTGVHVATVRVDKLTIEQSQRIMAAVLTALEAAHAHPRAKADQTA